MKDLRTLTVNKIELESDRTLLYGEDNEYHLIDVVNSTVKIGEVVEYEPYGVNFGWVVGRESNV